MNNLSGYVAYDTREKQYLTKDGSYEESILEKECLFSSIEGVFEAFGKAELTSEDMKDFEVKRITLTIEESFSIETHYLLVKRS